MRPSQSLKWVMWPVFLICNVAGARRWILTTTWCPGLECVEPYVSTSYVRCLNVEEGKAHRQKFVLKPLSTHDCRNRGNWTQRHSRRGYGKKRRGTRALMLHNYGRQRITKKRGSRLCSWELREIMAAKKCRSSPGNSNIVCIQRQMLLKCWNNFNSKFFPT